MPLFTRTGPTADGDFPGKRKKFLDRVWRWSLFLSLGNMLRTPFGLLVFFRLHQLEEREKPAEVEPPWHGIAEAELSDAEEHEAQRQLAREWRRDE
jgi:hypothetical protein